MLAVQDINDPVMWALPARATSRQPELFSGGTASPSLVGDPETPQKGIRGEALAEAGEAEDGKSPVLVMGAGDTSTDEDAITATPKGSTRSPVSCPLSPAQDSLPGTVSSGGAVDVAVDVASTSDEGEDGD